MLFFAQFLNYTLKIVSTALIKFGVSYQNRKNILSPIAHVRTYEESYC